MVVVLDELDPSGGLFVVVVVSVFVLESFDAGGTTITGGVAGWLLMMVFPGALSWTTRVVPGSTTTAGS